MAPSECRKCRRFVHWGARICPSCGCESPTSQEGIPSKRRIRKRSDAGGGSEPSLVGNWFFILVCIILAALGMLALLFDRLGWERFFPSGDWG